MTEIKEDFFAQLQQEKLKQKGMQKRLNSQMRQEKENYEQLLNSLQNEHSQDSEKINLLEHEFVNKSVDYQVLQQQFEVLNERFLQISAESLASKELHAANQKRLEGSLLT